MWKACRVIAIGSGLAEMLYKGLQALEKGGDCPTETAENSTLEAC